MFVTTKQRSINLIMERQIIIMNFTHVYEQERFLRNKRFQWIDCSSINGTDCYCDDTAMRILKQRIAPYSPAGIHFIDSGDYHYVSKLWTDKISKPFSLIVFDHHPDMQPTLFDNLMSCGCWVKEVLETNPNIRKVCIIGASEALLQRIKGQFPEQLVFYSEQELSHEEGWKRFAANHLNEPVYISVDKDVLNHESALTNWDQGSLTLKELEELLTLILRKQDVIGIDICGEDATPLDWFEAEEAEKRNSQANQALVECVFNTGAE